MGAGITNNKTPRKMTMLAAEVQCLRHNKYGSTAMGKTLIAVASANMLPEAHARPCCSHQKPRSIMASSTRLGWPRSNISNTNDIVRTDGSAAIHGSGALPNPVMAFESCAVIHHAATLSNDNPR